MLPVVNPSFVQRAIGLAMNGRGRVEPNPMVGCVLARDGRVVGEGWHARFGGPHAEPNALADCRARGESPAGATAFVTLEPCCHEGKKTPPCAPALIEAGVARVVVGCLDPNPRVNGGGVAVLRAAGVAVDLAPEDLAAECRQLIAPFLAGVSYGRPYVTLKWAESANGRVAGVGGRPVRITNAASDRAVHLLRGRCDVVAVGTNTVRNDDPSLTVRRSEHGLSRDDAPRDPIRVVLSNGLSIDPARRLVATARDVPTVVYCSADAVQRHAERAAALRSAGVEVVGLPTSHDQGTHPSAGGRFSFGDALADLYRRGVTHLLVEPGPTLAASLVARGQADRAWVFRSRRDVEPASTLLAPAMPWAAVGAVDLDGDRLTEHLNPSGDVFHAGVPSADFQEVVGRGGGD